MAGASDCDIMLSYCPDDRKIVRKIYDELKNSGFNCWMDKHKSTGSVATRAVDSCEVFLMCYSHEYFGDKDCRAEAEYANNSHTTIIPCLLDRDYVPTGWLGVLKGSKQVFDFSGRYSFEEVMENLIEEIRTHEAFSAPVDEEDQGDDD